jgi:hypothetical protein
MSEPKVIHKTERITVALISQAIAARDRLRDRTGLSQTDIVNRALQLYDFVNEKNQAGDDLLLRHPDQTTELVRFL